ncbi:MAG: hypothetical protein R2798_05365 [Chitinophagales bacterium]|nr:hypothetical protein [Bacteroidota bacterium]MCB9042653.1 hypothetical protein [Chitinophagales bacterium]
MIRDISFRKVEDIILAVVPEKETEDGLALFSTYIINNKDKNLQNVLVASKGIGEVDGKMLKTTAFTTIIEQLGSQTCVKIDSFEKDAAVLSNEYWVSFRLHDYLYDRKFVFVPGSIHQDNFTEIPILQQKGVMIA